MLKKIDLKHIGLTEKLIEEASTRGKRFYLARVSAQHRNIYKVLTEHGEIPAEVSGKLSFTASNPADFPAVGDWVMVDRTNSDGGNAIINYVLTRQSCLTRKAAGTGYDQQVIAANIDTLFICMSLNKDYNLRRIERYLTIAWDSMATPVIVLTKSDLCPDLASRLLDIQAVALGVDVVVTSGISQDGYSGILTYLSSGKTIAFIGSSGVGKSTLINNLLGKETLAVKDIREDDDKGRHTTTHRQLFVLPDGGIVVDTPGMREIQITVNDLHKSFADIKELALTCKFGDCRHKSEPGCAVKKAIENGNLSEKRLANYNKLQQEARYIKRKSTMNAAQAEKQKTIDMVGSLNGYKQALKNKKKTTGRR